VPIRAFSRFGTIGDMGAVGNDVHLYQRFQSVPGFRRSAPGVRPSQTSALHAGNGFQKRSKTCTIRHCASTFGAETSTASDTWLCNLARLGPLEAGILNPRRSATLAIAFYPAAVIAGWAFVSLTCTASPRIENAALAHAVDRLAPSLTASIDVTAKPQIEPQTKAQQAIAMDHVVPDTPEVAAAAELVAKSVADMKSDAAPAAAEAEPKPVEPKSFVLASLGDPAQILPSDTPSVQTATAGTADPLPPETRTAPSRIEIVGECLDPAPCIDQYLYALYQRTPKEDTIKETEKRKVEVKRRGKLVTITRSFTKLVENDFAWKDPNAAERAGMSMSDYVIGGMDKRFKLKLFYMLQAAENAGLQPGISSAFRDDYRQSIASGLKAASNRSYHGGSLRGGYGHGLAADITSVNGVNRAQRWTSTEALWKWIDANGKQFGIGRPYLAFDPPHVGPIDGPEYVSRRGGGTKSAGADAKKRQKHAAQARPGTANHRVAARPSSGKPSSRLAAAR
jgi:hypothetical protein